VHGMRSVSLCGELRLCTELMVVQNALQGRPQSESKATALETSVLL
jgi:hypothetical protein